MFRVVEGATELVKVRRKETKDIAQRLGYIAPSKIHIRNHPIETPVAAFNPALYANNEYLKLYPRIIVGYYMYVSAIAAVEIPISDLEGGKFEHAHFSADIVLYPDCRYDVWGAEDPRVNVINDTAYMVYTGRSINYFNPVVRKERTLPIVAVSNANDGRRWVKKGVFVLPDIFRNHIVSDKDAFVVRTPDDQLWLFHRPHTDDEVFHLVVSKITVDPRDVESFSEIRVVDTHVVLTPAPFEIKLGWAAPPIEVEPGRYLALIHAVDREVEAYKVFAALFRYEQGKGFVPEAVTPFYIMEPRTIYEVYGDRPLVVFPCGNVLVDDQIVVAYGAADYVVGIARIDKQELLSLLEKGSAS